MDGDCEIIIIEPADLFKPPYRYFYYFWVRIYYPDILARFRSLSKI